MEACLRPELWPWIVHQLTSWSKCPGTKNEHILAYWRDGKKYVGLLGYYLNYIVQFADSSTDHQFIGLMDEVLSIHQPCFTAIHWKRTEKQDMCLRNMDAPSGNKVEIWQKSLHFDPAPPKGHEMWVKCEQSIDGLTVQVWLLYHHPNFKYCTLFESGTELRTNGWTDGRTDDPITRCPRRTFQAGGIKSIQQICQGCVLMTLTFNYIPEI